MMPTNEKVINNKKIVSIDNQPNHEFDQLLVNRTANNQTTEMIKSDSKEDDLVGLEFEQLKPEEKVLIDEFKVEYVWRNIIFFFFMHLCIPYAFIVGWYEEKYYLFFWRKFFFYELFLSNFHSQSFFLIKKIRYILRLHGWLRCNCWCT